MGLLLILWSAALVLQALLWRHFRKDAFTGAILWAAVLILLISPMLGNILAWI